MIGEGLGRQDGRILSDHERKLRCHIPPRTITGADRGWPLAARDAEGGTSLGSVRRAQLRGAGADRGQGARYGSDVTLPRDFIDAPLVLDSAPTEATAVDEKTPKASERVGRCRGARVDALGIASDLPAAIWSVPSFRGALR